MTERQYIYKITEVVKVVDGDSFWLRVDVGFRQENLINVRLLGFDCPEAHRGSDFEKQEAIEARKIASEFLTSELGLGRSLWIRTEKDPDNFGRWLGDIWSELPVGDWHLGEYLQSHNLASVWPTRWRDEFEHLDAIPVDAP